MNKFKILFLAFLFAVSLLVGCTTSKSSLNEQPVKIKEFNRNEYVVLDNVVGKAKSFRFWFLFIPFGGKQDQVLYDAAYDRAIKSAVGQKADGLLQPRYTYKKTIYPFIIISFTTKKVTAEGKAFRLKSEEEYQKSK